MGRMGGVDSGSLLVYVVACLAMWMCVTSVVLFLRKIEWLFPNFTMRFWWLKEGGKGERGDSFPLFFSFLSVFVLYVMLLYSKKLLCQF